MIEIRMRAGRLPPAQPKSHHISVIQLVRIVNALRAEHRLFAILDETGQLNEDNLIGSKIRLELFLKQSAILFESRKTIVFILKKLKKK